MKNFENRKKTFKSNRPKRPGFGEKFAKKSKIVLETKNIWFPKLDRILY
jgi:hypothetical protein